MKADSRTEGEVKATLQRLTDAFGKRDLKAFLECFAPDADVVVYGTARKSALVRNRSVLRSSVTEPKVKAPRCCFGSTSISTSGPIAWVAVDGTFKFRAGEKDGTIPARVSLFWRET